MREFNARVSTQLLVNGAQDNFSTNLFGYLDSLHGSYAVIDTVISSVYFIQRGKGPVISVEWKERNMQTIDPIYNCSCRLIVKVLFPIFLNNFYQASPHVYKSYIYS